MPKAKCPRCGTETEFPDITIKKCPTCGDWPSDITLLKENVVDIKNKKDAQDVTIADLLRRVQILESRLVKLEGKVG